MVDQVMTKGTNLAGITPELWSAAFYPTLLASLVFNSSVSRDYEGEIRALGDQVHINDFPEFDEADEFLEDERVDADAITANKQTLTINKAVAKDYIVTERATIQALDAGNRIRDLAMYSILKKMQRIIIAEIVPSASPDHTLGYGSGTTLALADILAAKESLDNENVEEAGRKMIVGSAQYNDIFNITGFTSRDFTPGTASLSQGAITTPVLGFDFGWTTEAGNVSYFFHPMFLTLAVQKSPSVKVYDLGVDGKRASRVNMDVLFGLKQLSNLRVTTIS